MQKFRAYYTPKPLPKTRIIGCAFMPETSYRSSCAGMVTGQREKPELPFAGFPSNADAWREYVSCVRATAAEYAKVVS